MFELSKEEVRKILSNYKKLLDRVCEVVEEIGFLTEEFDTLELYKTEFDKERVYVTAYDSHYDFYDAVTGSFPIEFLFEDSEKHKDWDKQIREELQKQKKLKEEQVLKEKELSELQRLKEKYE